MSEDSDFLDKAIRHPEILTPDGALRLFDCVQNLRAKLSECEREREAAGKSLDVHASILDRVEKENTALKARVQEIEADLSDKLAEVRENTLAEVNDWLEDIYEGNQDTIFAAFQEKFPAKAKSYEGREGA